MTNVANLYPDKKVNKLTTAGADKGMSMHIPMKTDILVVYHLGRFAQMVSKFPYWDNSVRDWRLPFVVIPTIYQKICTTATANEKVANKSFD